MAELPSDTDVTVGGVGARAALGAAGGEAVWGGSGVGAGAGTGGESEVEAGVADDSGIGAIELEHGQGGQGVHEKAYGPLWLVEAERAMGMPDGVTAFTVDGDAVGDKDRWRLVGNSYCVPVVEHLVMCALEAQGLITRNDVRQTGVIFTVNQDGPLDWRAEVEKRKQELREQAGLEQPARKVARRGTSDTTAGGTAGGINTATKVGRGDG